MDFQKIIIEIINSLEFKKKLNFINDNYSNLKQEIFVRNVLLESLNDYFKSNFHSNLRAFAEQRFGKIRVDLTIVNSDELSKPYKIELKYHFSKDNNNMKDYERVIGREFENRKSDMFILVISHWEIEQKGIFNEKWKITPNLSQYISTGNDWKGNILKCFECYTKANHLKISEVTIDLPHKTEYYFYVLKRG